MADRRRTSLRRKVEEYERRFRILDEQMRLLEQERQKLSAVVSHTDAGFLVFDRELRVTWANNIFLSRFCTDPDPAALLNARCHQILCHVDRPCDNCPAAQPFRSGIVAHQEMRLQLQEQTRHIYATAMPIKSLAGRVEQTILMVQDLTDLDVLRESKEALQTSEQRFRSIFEHAALGMGTATPEGRYLQVNPALCRFLGYERDELLHMTVLDVTHPEDREATWRAMQETQKNQGTIGMEKRYLRKDGTIVWGYLSATWMRDPEGRPEFAVGLVQDIDERKRAQESLTRSEIRKGAILDTALDAIFSIDSEGRIVEFNPAAERLFGYARVEAIGREMAELIVPQRLRGTQREAMARYASTGESELIGRRVEITAMRADRTEFPAEIAIARVPLPGPPMFTAFVRDLSERRKVESSLRDSEEQLLQAQKMEAVGRLAGGVAHDFNNLLTVINGRCQLLQRDLADHPLRKEVEVIARAGGQAASLTRQLLAFSRRQPIDARVVDLNGLVSELDKMLRRLIGEDITLELKLKPEPGNVRVDPGQIEQVIMNLAVNARDAMPRGGHLTIETGNEEVRSPIITPTGRVEPGLYVSLSVRDGGTGMDPDVLAHVFEPYFTTKEKGKGTGLGLATVASIVKRVGGQIQIESTPGAGTRFTIHLPRVQETAETRAPEPAPQALRRGTETILVVEDERTVRELARELLELNGYTVLEAAHGRDAVSLCRSHEGPIHLLLTDVIMPHMNGQELAETLAPLRPGMKVLYMSGYTEEDGPLGHIVRSEATFLRKPFTPSDLASKVRALLETAGRN